MRQCNKGFRASGGCWSLVRARSVNSETLPGRNESRKQKGFGFEGLRDLGFRGSGLGIYRGQALRIGIFGVEGSE